MSVCLLSLGGIPPFAGFFGKLYLFWCGWNSRFYLLVYIAVITSVISMYYYLRVIKAMVTKEAREMSPYVHDYVMPTCYKLPDSALRTAITLCVLASTMLGLVINALIASTNQITLIDGVFLG
jgi:NAD(P)H-quinone oxidoreductase subunit 2